MKLNRNYVTPFISLVFFIVGLSGIFMFFHLFDDYTEIVHEYLGVFFAICAIFHIILNWKGLKVHFKKGVFLPASFGILTVSIILIISQQLNPPIDTVIIKKVVKAPIIDAFKVLGINYEKAAERLKEKQISIEKAETLEDIWLNNNTDPEEVIDLIIK